MKKIYKGKVAIIGAGPTGYTAAITALDLGFEVELIDPWKFAEPILDGQINFETKSRFGSVEMYDYPSKYLNSSDNHNLGASSVVGGFSTVWGAGLSFDTSVFKEVYEPEQINAAEKTVRKIFKDFLGAHYISKRFQKLLGPSRNFFPSQLAVSPSLCTLKGLCMTGCSKGAIWSSEEPWKRLVNSGVLVRKGFASKIEEKVTQVLVHIDIENQIKIEKYDYVLVACGAIGSVSLGQRSGILPNQVELGETSISYIPILIFNQLKSHVERIFTLSQIFYIKKIPNEDKELSLSLYEASDFLKQQAKLRLKWFFRLIPKVIWGYLGVAIAYKPEALSKRISIKLENGVSSVSSDGSSPSSNTYFLSLFRNIRKDFYSSGLFFYPTIRLDGKSRDSYHIGHLTSKNQEIFDISGKTKIYSKVSFVDSASLNELPAGPITAIAMMNACIKTTLSLKNI